MRGLSLFSRFFLALFKQNKQSVTSDFYFPVYLSQDALSAVYRMLM